MSLTLLVESNSNIQSVYRLNLSTWLGLTLVTKVSAQAAAEFLLAKPTEVGLVIVRSHIGKETSGKNLIEFLKAKNFTIPVIEIGPGTQTEGCFAHVPNSLEIKALIQNCAKALKITAKEMSEKIVPDYFPIPVEYFKTIKRSTCPVYAKNEENYELRVNKNIDFDAGFIKFISESPESLLYVNKLDRLEFVNYVTSEIMSELSMPEVSQDEEITASARSLELLSKKLLSIGVTEETIKLAKKNMDTMRKNVKSHPKLSKLIDRLLNNKTSYLFKHTQILTYVGLHIVKNIDWGNPEQEDKISFIAFFHDIVLDTDEQAQIRSSLELKKSQMDAGQKLMVERHAQMAAEFVSKFPHAPMGADQIIRQHHGTLNGIGFSEHYGNNVSPVAIVFIVAEEFTRIILKRETGPFDRAEMLRELKEEFPTSRFQKIVDLLQTITF